jgi:hypothetical protein
LEKFGNSHKKEKIKMQVVTKQISVLISEEEQDRLFELVDKVSDTYVCELIHCASCANDVCEVDVCPFHKLDTELRNVTDKIFRAAKEYGPKGAE